MAVDRRQTILTLNVGSSSLKAALFPAADPSTAIAHRTIDRIGTDSASPDHPTAFRSIDTWLSAAHDSAAISAIGHRVVHGGRAFTEPTVLTRDVESTLADLVALDPGHMPQCLATIRAAREAFPDVPHVAVFDTAFHRTMSAAERTLPIPGVFADAGFERYGFHGLSYESVVVNLRAAGELPERLIVAHLGSGCSLCAIADGTSRATTMGYTPTGGVIMGTRSGDLDPGVIFALHRQTELSIDEIEQMLNKESGLLGISGTSNDMRTLLANQASNPHAALAIAMFVASVQKAIGALGTVLGGLDALVFTGGVGENAASIRAAICAPLAFLGIRIDPGQNAFSERVISAATSRVAVRVIPGDEQGVIACAVARTITPET